MTEFPTATNSPRPKFVTRKRLWHLLELLVLAIAAALIKGAWDLWGHKETPSAAATAVASPTISPTISPSFSVTVPVPPPSQPLLRDQETRARQSSTPKTPRKGSKFDLHGSKFDGPTQIGDGNTQIVPKHWRTLPCAELVAKIPYGRKVEIGLAVDGAEPAHYAELIVNCLKTNGYEVGPLNKVLTTIGPQMVGTLGFDDHPDRNVTTLTVFDGAD
jgi:hypothetical protein